MNKSIVSIVLFFMAFSVHASDRVQAFALIQGRNMKQCMNAFKILERGSYEKAANYIKAHPEDAKFIKLVLGSRRDEYKESLLHLLHEDKNSDSKQSNN